MKLKAIIAFSPFILLIACHREKENTSAPGEQAEPSVEKNATGNCYRYADPTDTITLKVVHTSDSITGNLVYNLSGKDKNIGTIAGKMHGDMLVANYTFNSEGISSTREVAFKLTEGGFVEGFGDVDVQNNYVHFKDIDKLTYNDGFKLVEIPCP